MFVLVGVGSQQQVYQRQHRSGKFHDTMSRVLHADIRQVASESRPPEETPVWLVLIQSNDTMLPGETGNAWETATTLKML
jgi:hypothetical protein